MNIHKLKSWPDSFKAIKKGKKTCDLRFNDRGYEVGDIILFEEYDPNQVIGNIMEGVYTGDATIRRISYIQIGGFFGLDKSCVCLSLKRIK